MLRMFPFAVKIGRAFVRFRERFVGNEAPHADWSDCSRRQWRRALNLSALVGYFLFAGAPSLLAEEIGGIVRGAPVGIPVALLCFWLFGAPLLRRAMTREIGWVWAASLGALIVATMVPVSVAIGRGLGGAGSINPSFQGRVGYEDFTQSIDGALTPYGRLVPAERVLLFILMGLRWP